MLQLIMLFAPACIASLIFERFGRGSFTLPRLAVYTFCFAFLINAMTYIAIWLRGHTVINWESLGDAANVSFCVKYMGLSLVFAVLLALFAVGVNNIKAGKKND